MFLNKWEINVALHTACTEASELRCLEHGLKKNKEKKSRVRLISDYSLFIYPFICG